MHSTAVLCRSVGHLKAARNTNLLVDKIEFKDRNKSLVNSLIPQDRELLLYTLEQTIAFPVACILIKTADCKKLSLWSDAPVIGNVRIAYRIKFEMNN